ISGGQCATGASARGSRVASASSAASRRRPTNDPRANGDGRDLTFPRFRCSSLPMHRPLRRVLTLAALILAVTSARAALQTQNIVGGLTPTDLVNAILGSGVAISNVSLRGCETGLGTFTGG